MEELPPLPKVGYNAIPSLDLTSGLFDTGFTGEVDLDLLSPVHSDTTFDLDFSNTLEADQLFDMLGHSGMNSSDLKELNTPELDKNHLDLEVFTDLSGYAQEKTMETSDLSLLTSRVRKRKADVGPVNTDHDGYISKKPKTVSTKASYTKPALPTPKLSVASVSSVEELDTTEAESVSVKDAKYMERRRKNNIASHRSRETRKAKYVAMELQADELVKANEELRIRVEQLEKVTKLMKDTLVARLAQGK